MQTRVGSFIEAIINVLVGFTIATIANLVFIPMFGYPITLEDSIGVGAILTVISIIRSYTLRRIFNWFVLRKYRRG